MSFGDSFIENWRENFKGNYNLDPTLKQWTRMGNGKKLAPHVTQRDSKLEFAIEILKVWSTRKIIVNPIIKLIIINKSDMDFEHSSF